MLKGTLQEAVEIETPPPHETLLGSRRMMFLSGMFGSEVVEIVAAYKQTGLPPCIFAAAVPNNYGKVVGTLVKEVSMDHDAMVGVTLLLIIIQTWPLGLQACHTKSH